MSERNENPKPKYYPPSEPNNLTYQEQFSKELTVSQLRGAIIHFMVMLETNLEEAITLHFFDDEDRATEFTHSILSKELIGSQFKLDVFKFIVENNYPEFNTMNPDFFPNYKKMITWRNDFAHRKFYSKKDINGKVDENYLEHYSTESSKVKVKTTKITDEIVKTNNELILSLMEDLRLFKKYMWQRKTMLEMGMVKELSAEKDHSSQEAQSRPAD
jgi:hypothetical protein